MQDVLIQASFLTDVCNKRVMIRGVRKTKH